MSPIIYWIQRTEIYENLYLRKNSFKLFIQIELINNVSSCLECGAIIILFVLIKLIHIEGVQWLLV